MSIESWIRRADDDPELARIVIGYAAQLMLHGRALPAPVAAWLGPRLMRVAEHEPADTALGLKRQHGDRSNKPALTEIKLAMMAARRVARGLSDTEAGRACADLWDEDESTWHKLRRKHRDQYDRMVWNMEEGLLPTDVYLAGEKDDSSSS